MPKRKNETNRQYMDRLREARGLPPQGKTPAEDTMILARATRCIVETVNNPENYKRMRLRGFLAVCEPQIPVAKADRMVRSAYAPD